jgi:hypothetical protein
MNIIAHWDSSKLVAIKSYVRLIVWATQIRTAEGPKELPKIPQNSPKKLQNSPKKPQNSPKTTEFVT